MNLGFILVFSLYIISLQSYATTMNTDAHSIKKVLILIHSRTGNTLLAAQKIKTGMERNGTISAEIKRVPSFLLLPPVTEEVEGLSLASLEDLQNSDAIIFGSPIYFYGPAAELLAFLQGGMELWKNQSLKDKWAGFFFTSNGNGIRFAKETLKASLGAFSMDTRSLENICDSGSSNGNDFNEYGACLERALVGLPPVPEPVGLYKPFRIAGNLVFINQIALKDGHVLNPGIIDETVSEEEAKASTRLTMLNVLAVLHKALDGDFSRVKQVVQISGYFNVRTNYQNHSAILNEASKVAVEWFGEERGIAARAAFGVSSLPLNSPVEIQAIIEIER